jgi:DNA polymerase III delta prime subunit
MAISFMSYGLDEQRELIERHVISNTYPNFFAIKCEGEISIDSSRQMIDFLLKKPVISGGMAVIIENPETMSKNAANSILKILEEMPNDSLMILATSRMLSIIPTIRSRCEKVRCEYDVCQAHSFGSVAEYIRANCEDISAESIEQISAFIESKSWSTDMLVLKKLSCNIETLLRIAIAHHAYHCRTKFSVLDAKKVLALQGLLDMSRNTYPDDQAMVNVVKIISEAEMCDFA